MCFAIATPSQLMIVFHHQEICLPLSYLARRIFSPIRVFSFERRVTVLLDNLHNNIETILQLQHSSLGLGTTCFQHFCLC